MAPPPRIKNGSGGGGAMALAAAVLALSHILLLLATHSDACSSSPSSSCPNKPPAAPAPCPPAASNAPSGGKCPVSALKLGACASVLGGLASLELGQPEQGSASASSSSSSSSTQPPCCQLLGGLADLDAAVCLCTALRANVLGVVQLSLPVELSVLVNHCGKKLPEGFHCTS